MVSPDYQELLPAGGGVIFDMDGLLLDTEALARKTWREAAESFGHQLHDHLFRKMIGRRNDFCASELGKAFGPAFSFSLFLAEVDQRTDAFISQHGMPVKPGAHDLVRYLLAENIPIAVATSTARPKATRHLEAAGLLKFFSVLVTGDEIALGKPAPDIYLAAAKRLGVSTARSLALEDSFPGVQSAHAAGLKAIMVPDLLEPTEEIRKLTWRVEPSLDAVRLGLASARSSLRAT
jgi:HAD superfamily hydrolase (TIGR01509 family)